MCVWLAAATLATVPMTLHVHDESGAMLPSLQAALVRAIGVDGGEVVESTGEPGCVVELFVTAQPDGLFHLEARRGRRHAEADVRVSSPHAFEQARTLAVRGLTLADEITRAVRSPPPHALPQAPSASLRSPIAEMPLPESSPPLLVPLATAAPTPKEPPSAPPSAVSPQPAPPKRPAVSSEEDGPAPPRPAARTFFDEPEHPHLGLAAGGAILMWASTPAAWSWCFVAAARVEAGPVELTLRTTVPPQTSLSAQETAWRYPVDLTASLEVPGASSLRLGAGVEGVIMDQRDPPLLSYGMRPVPPTTSSTLLPGVVTQLGYRPGHGRFALTTVASLAWHPEPDPRTPAPLTYPEWTVTLGLALDATVW